MRPLRRCPRGSDRSIATLLAVAMVALPMFPSRAAPSPAKSAAPAPSVSVDPAVQLKAEGDKAFDAFLYADALRAYESAYELSHDPALLFNRGRALQALTRYAEALEMFERFDREAPQALRAKVPGLAKLIADVRARVATLRIVCNVEGAQVVVGDRVLGETGSLGDVPVNAGATTVRVRREGYFPVTRPLTLEGGKTTTVTLVLLPRATSGVLAVVVDPAAAKVSVDGKFEGNSPVELVLPAGTHAVEVTSPGFEALTSKAVVRADGRVEVRLAMQATPGITSRWWFWTGVGAVVVTGVVIGIALTTNRSPHDGDFSPGRVTAPLITF